MLTSGSGEDAAFQESVAFCDSLSYPLRGLIHSAPTLPQVCFPHSQSSSAVFDWVCPQFVWERGPPEHGETVRPERSDHPGGNHRLHCQSLQQFCRHAFHSSGRHCELHLHWLQLEMGLWGGVWCGLLGNSCPGLQWSQTITYRHPSEVRRAVARHWVHPAVNVWVRRCKIWHIFQHWRELWKIPNG